MERNNSEEELYGITCQLWQMTAQLTMVILSFLSYWFVNHLLNYTGIAYSCCVPHWAPGSTKEEATICSQGAEKTQLGRWHKSLFQFDNDLHGMITFNGYSPNRVKQSIISTAKKQTEFSIKYQSLDTCFSSQLCKGQVSTTAKWRWHAATPLKWLL